MTPDPVEEMVRKVAYSLPPSDFGSTRAIRAMADAIRPLIEAAPKAAEILEDYAAYLHTIPARELEVHPYLPEVEDAAAALRAASSLPLNGDGAL